MRTATIHSFDQARLARGLPGAPQAESPKPGEGPSPIARAPSSPETPLDWRTRACADLLTAIERTPWCRPVVRLAFGLDGVARVQVCVGSWALGFDEEAARLAAGALAASGEPGSAGVASAILQAADEVQVLTVPAVPPSPSSGDRLVAALMAVAAVVLAVALWAIDRPAIGG